jgi:8-oxo-dGTP pyrophosphatase MutT (NUDIX family)
MRIMSALVFRRDNDPPSGPAFRDPPQYWGHFLHFASVFGRAIFDGTSERFALRRKKIIERARKGRPIRQFAAVPFRLTADGKMEVMLITSRSTRRFILPKGWPMKGRSGQETARIEAQQEAGVDGRMLEEPIGSYRYWKRLSRQFVPVEVIVYLMSVEDVLDEWEEAGSRQRAWLSPMDAATLVDEPELAQLMSSLQPAQASAHGG